MIIDEKALPTVARELLAEAKATAKRLYGDRLVKVEVAHGAGFCASIHLKKPPADIYGRGRSERSALRSLLSVLDAMKFRDFERSEGIDGGAA